MLPEFLNRATFMIKYHLSAKTLGKNNISCNIYAKFLFFLRKKGLYLSV